MGNTGSLSRDEPAAQVGLQSPQTSAVPEEDSGATAQEARTTKTVRNDLNLQKSSLRVTPAAGNPNELLVSFRFDANVPCEITVFFVARDNPDAAHRSMLESKVSSSPAVAEYPAGLGLAFAQAPGQGLDTTLYAEHLEYEEGKEFYPLVVRLEALGYPGVSTLSDEARNSQLTYASICRSSTGEFSLQVLKQKILVGGQIYELQEIYGMESRSMPAPPGADQDPNFGKECVICMVEPKDTAVLPCRHMCMCGECAKVMRLVRDTCPICRTRVESMVRIPQVPRGGEHQAAPGWVDVEPQPPRE